MMKLWWWSQHVKKIEFSFFTEKIFLWRRGLEGDIDGECVCCFLLRKKFSFCLWEMMSERLVWLFWSSLCVIGRKRRGSMMWWMKVFDGMKCKIKLGWVIEEGYSWKGKKLLLYYFLLRTKASPAAQRFFLLLNIGSPHSICATWICLCGAWRFYWERTNVGRKKKRKKYPNNGHVL